MSYVFPAKKAILLCLSLSVFAGIIGLVKDSDAIVNTAFDILSLEALLLIPR